MIARTNDPEVVRAEYEDESRFAVRATAWANATGPSARDVDRALAELARVLSPDGRLVAVTNSEDNLPELWHSLRGDEHRVHAFSVENAEPQLARHFGRIDRRDANGTVTFPNWEAARGYVESSVTRSRLADALPRFDGPLVCTRLVSVVVAAEPL